MLSKREKNLLNILLWIVIAVLLVLFFLLQFERKSSFKERVELMEEQLKRYNIEVPKEEELIKKLDLSNEKMKEIKDKFYRKDVIDPYSFGIIIRDLIKAEGLEINRYKTIEVDHRTYLEFALKGDAIGFFSFLKKVSDSEKYWFIPFISIKPGGIPGEINSVLRISYEEIN